MKERSEKKDNNNIETESCRKEKLRNKTKRKEKKRTNVSIFLFRCVSFFLSFFLFSTERSSVQCIFRMVHEMAFNSQKFGYTFLPLIFLLSCTRSHNSLKPSIL